MGRWTKWRGGGGTDTICLTHTKGGYNTAGYRPMYVCGVEAASKSECAAKHWLTPMGKAEHQFASAGAQMQRAYAPAMAGAHVTSLSQNDTSLSSFMIIALFFHYDVRSFMTLNNAMRQLSYCNVQRIDSPRTGCNAQDSCHTRQLPYRIPERLERTPSTNLYLRAHRAPTGHVSKRIRAMSFTPNSNS